MLICLACVLFAIFVFIGLYIFRCTRYWQKDLKRAVDVGFLEKQVKLPDGSVINYAEGPNNGSALLLIHGQTSAWRDYARVLPSLSEIWHVFAVDCYGHGGSSHNAEKYYLDKNGDDLIWFLNNVIRKTTVVSGHSSGGLLASYIAANGGRLIKGAVLEDPPVFSCEKENFSDTFAYHDAYKPIHDYLQNEQDLCWEAYYLRNCLWGQLYAPKIKDKLADIAEQQHKKRPQNAIQFFFMPESINVIFLYMRDYDLLFGEKFYDFSWHGKLKHADLMSSISIPTIFIHANEMYADNGILLAASSNEQAQKAAQLMGDCQLIQLTSNHNIHRFKPKVFIETVNKMRDKGVLER